MGISLKTLNVLVNESQRVDFKNQKIITLGKQQVFITPKELDAFSNKSTLKNKYKLDLDLNPINNEKNFVSFNTISQFLGFTECISFDYSNYENADVIGDLNKKYSKINLLNKIFKKFTKNKINNTNQLYGYADVVLDGGTIEHVFNLQNCFYNLFNFIKVGGRIIHFSPSSNYIDHGFYMFSPTFFIDFYTANNFEINTIQIYRHKNNIKSDWEIFDYVQGSLQRVSMGGLDDSMYGIICIVTKQKESTWNKIPYQGMYIKGHWAEGEYFSHKNVELENSIDPNFNGKGLGLRKKMTI